MVTCDPHGAGFTRPEQSRAKPRSPFCTLFRGLARGDTRSRPRWARYVAISPYADSRSGDFSGAGHAVSISSSAQCRMTQKPLPLDTCVYPARRPGFTLIQLGGAALKETLDCCGNLADEGVDAEVIDCRHAKPVDGLRPFCGIGEQNGRCVIVCQAHCSFRLGAEIAALLHERRGWTALRAPVARL